MANTDIQSEFQHRIDRLCSRNTDFGVVWNRLRHLDQGIILGGFIRQLFDGNDTYYLELFRTTFLGLSWLKDLKHVVKPEKRPEYMCIHYKFKGFTICVIMSSNYEIKVDLSINRLYYDFKTKSICHANPNEINSILNCFEKKVFTLYYDQYLSDVVANHLMERMTEATNNNYKINSDDSTTCEMLTKVLTLTQGFDDFSSQRLPLIKQLLQFLIDKTIPTESYKYKFLSRAVITASLTGDAETFELAEKCNYSSTQWRTTAVRHVCSNLIAGNYNDLLEKMGLITLFRKRSPLHMHDIIFKACSSGNLCALKKMETDCKIFFLEYFNHSDTLNYLAQQNDVLLLQFAEERGLIDEFRDKSDALHIALEYKNINVAEWLHNMSFHFKKRTVHYFGEYVMCPEFFDHKNHDALKFCKNHLAIKFGENELRYNLKKLAHENVLFLLEDCKIDYRVNITDNIFEFYLDGFYEKQIKEWLLLLRSFTKIGRNTAILHNIYKSYRKEKYSFHHDWNKQSLRKYKYATLTYFLLINRLPTQLIDYLGSFLYQ